SARIGHGRTITPRSMSIRTSLIRWVWLSFTSRTRRGSRRRRSRRGCVVDCTIVVPVWCFDRRISQVWKDAERAFRANSDGARLYVVDNGSAVPIRADHRFEQNQGWAEAVNHGLAAADTEWIAVGSHDTIVPPGWLRPLLRSGIASPIEAGITEKKKKSRGSFFGSLF